LILAVSFLCVCPSRISANPDVRAVKIAEAKGRLFLLAIGIDHYVSAKLARLQLAAKDAREIAALLEKNADGVFDSTHKRVLLDEAATKRNIEAALDEFSRDIRAQDTFVFFYAGFGDKSNDNTDFYFILHDTDVDRRDSETWLSGREMRAWFRRIQAGNQLIILDSCNSAWAYESAAQTFLEKDTAVAALLKTNVMFLGTDTMSYEISSLGNGMVTKALLEGLSGSADTQKDNRVTVRELEAYLYTRGLQLSAQVRHSFHPRAVSRGDDFVIGGYSEETPTFGKQAIGKRNDSSAGGSEPRGPRANEPFGQQKTPVKRDGKDYALLFAIDEYDNGWRPLSNPIFDAEAIRGQLIGRYGFEAEPVVKNPSKREILDKIAAYRSRSFNEHDQLVIFLAGHGDSYKDTHEGFLVTRDSPAELTVDNDSQFIQLDRLLALINSIPCNHVLLVLDACYAGVLWEPRVRVVKQVGHLNDSPANHIRDERSADRFAAANSSFSDTPFFDGGWASGLLPAQRQTKDEYGEISRDEYILRVMNHRTRKLLTSGGNVPVPDGRAQKHSPFVSKLLQALEDNREKYGVLTSNDIYRYVNLITPQPFQGHLSDSDGEFVFIRRDATR
jgi:uncharacterized caspase-like protein